jgi:hypothetical protein
MSDTRDDDPARIDATLSALQGDTSREWLETSVALVMLDASESVMAGDVLLRAQERAGLLLRLDELKSRAATFANAVTQMNHARLSAQYTQIAQTPVVLAPLTFDLRPIR